MRQILEQKVRKLAIALRAKEAERRRGQPEMLHELEMTTDNELLRKFSWKAAILSAIGAFFLAPMFCMILRSLLPEILSQILWAIVKLAMALSCAMLGLAAYLTFKNDQDTQ